MADLNSLEVTPASFVTQVPDCQRGPKYDKGKRPEDMACDWLQETKSERLESCRIYLELEGLLTKRDNSTLKRRIKAWIRYKGKREV